MKLFKNPFFYTSLLSLMALGLIIASYVFGWTTPSTTPPGGNVTLQSSQWITSGSNIYYNLGNVGIGTTGPTSKLAVGGAARTTIPTAGSPTGTTFAMLELTNLYGLFGGVAGSGNSWLQAMRNDGDTSLYNLTLQPIGGNVGIGTTGPSSRLTVIGSWPQAYFTNQTGVSYGVVIGNDTVGTGAAIGAHHWNGTVYDAWADLVLQRGGGNVGIGISPTLAKLQVDGTISTKGSSIFAQSDNTNTAYNYAPIQIREALYGATGGYLPPRLSFHWAGVVASQIGIESSGRIAILNNPGTGYENLIANTFYGSGAGLTGIVTSPACTICYCGAANTCGSSWPSLQGVWVSNLSYNIWARGAACAGAFAWVSPNTGACLCCK